MKKTFLSVFFTANALRKASNALRKSLIRWGNAMAMLSNADSKFAKIHQISFEIRAPETSKRMQKTIYMWPAIHFAPGFWMEFSGISGWREHFR
jgi:hypothetical protein